MQFNFGIEVNTGAFDKSCLYLMFNLTFVILIYSKHRICLLCKQHPYQMKQDRNKAMLEIQNSLVSEVENLPFLGDKITNKKLKRRIEKRLAKPSVRSGFAFWVYEYVLKCANEEKIELSAINHDLLRIKLPLVIEMSMCSIYLHNQFLDKKNKVTSQRKTAKNAIQSQMLRDLITQYMDENFNEQFRTVNKKVTQIFRMVDAGQVLDKKCDLLAINSKNFVIPQINQKLQQEIQLGSIEDLKDNLFKDFPTYGAAINYYFTRNYLISSSLFKVLAEIIFALTGYSGEEKGNILQFAVNYGIMMQLLNDINDFVLEKGTENKKKVDVLSDLKNHVPTLPIFLHLAMNKKPGLVENFLFNKKKKKAIIQGKHNEILKELILSGALTSCVKITQQIANQSKPLIKNNCQAGCLLLDLFNITNNNRYYTHIYKARKFYKKEENENHIYRCEDFQSNSERSDKNRYKCA